VVPDGVRAARRGGQRLKCPRSSTSVTSNVGPKRVDCILKPTAPARGGRPQSAHGDSKTWEKQATARRGRERPESPRAACLRGPSAGFRIRCTAETPAPPVPRATVLADDAATGPRSQVEHGSGPASGAGHAGEGACNRHDQSRQVCGEARADQWGDPDPRRGTATFRCPTSDQRSSDGPANRLETTQEVKTPRLRNPGSIRPFLGMPTCPRAPGKTGSPVEIT